MDNNTYPNFNYFLESVKFEEYDIFLIFTAERVTVRHWKLADRIESKEKPFFFIRAKTDYDPQQQQDAEIIENVRKELQDFDFSDHKMYVISNRHPDRLEFGKLMKDIAICLPATKKKCFNEHRTIKELIALDEFQKFLRGIQLMQLICTRNYTGYSQPFIMTIILSYNRQSIG